jgi:hypothetical protein
MRACCTIPLSRACGRAVGLTGGDSRECKRPERRRRCGEELEGVDETRRCHARVRPTRPCERRHPRECIADASVGSARLTNAAPVNMPARTRADGCGGVAALSLRRRIRVRQYCNGDAQCDLRALADHWHADASLAEEAASRGITGGRAHSHELLDVSSVTRGR